MPMHSAIKPWWYSPQSTSSFLLGLSVWPYLEASSSPPC